MLQLREPRATPWPFPHPEATGGIIEAAMGLCLPWQEAHKEFRNQFAATWGFNLANFASLQHPGHLCSSPPRCIRSRLL
eukprot:3550611-Pyramimonas_sp.AAC.1